MIKVSGGNFKFIKNLVDTSDDKQFGFLKDFFENGDAVERATCHENYTVSFALNRAKARLESTKRNQKKTYGIEALIEALSKLDPAKRIDFYSFSSKRYVGTCFVFNGALIGHEFVERGGSMTVPGLDEKILNS